MNDRDEIRAGREALWRAIDDHKPPLEEWHLEQLSRIGVTRSANPHDLFLLCAAVEGDALTLWRGYGAGSEAEYAIDLDPNVALLPVQQSDAAKHPEPAPPGWGADAIDYTDEGVPFTTYAPDHAYSYGGVWGNVEYLHPTSTAAEKEVSRVLKTLRKPPEGKRTVPFIWGYLAGPDPTSNFKHPSFSDEREVRATWTVQPNWRFVLYRPGRFGITPYIEVGAFHPGDVDAQAALIRPDQIGRLPIRSIRIGPTRAAGDAEKSLRALLDRFGYGNVEIELSNVPYR